MNPIIIIIGAQLLFTASDLIGRYLMVTTGFTAASFLSPYFIVYVAIRNIAMIGQLYAFSQLQLGATMALFGAVSIVLANVLGLLFLKETLPLLAYIGVVLAIVAFLILAAQSK
jgi:multidrug transporter EmrE-like cation transporter